MLTRPNVHPARCDNWVTCNERRCRAYRGGRIENLKQAGWTLTQYLNAYDEQDGRCAICQRHEEALCADHDHKTLAPRALLCHGCNLGISNFDDDPRRLLAAADYLLEHQQVR